MSDLRSTFDSVADLYDRARPTYPAALLDDLSSLIPAAGRIVEIGPGTGQATLPLAERGFTIVAVELGVALAAFTQRKVASYPHVEIVNAAFETWEPVRAGFDAVVSFTAFHWLDPAVKYERSARLLRPGGLLAVVETEHVMVDGGDPFWLDVQEDYDAIVPSPHNRPPPSPADVGDLRAEIAATELFRDAEARRYRWDVTYGADEWIDVLRTYSPNLSRDPETIGRLLDRIRARIESLPVPRVTKHYLATLSIARSGAAAAA